MPATDGEVPWGQALLDVLVRLADFQRKVPDLVGA